jgi:hypothetical protein
MIEHIAIIGLGNIGQRHLRLARKFRPKLEITVVRSGVGQEIPEEKIADKVVNTIEDALARGIQAAVIATPAVLHLDQATILLRAGVHVLVEKPLSNSMAGVSELMKLQKESGLVGLLGYCLRYDPSAKQFTKMLKNNVVGQILHVHVDCGSYLPNWRPNKDYRHTVSAKKELGGGVLLELSHELDYACWFFGPFNTVTAVLHNTGTLGLGVEDSADFILKSIEDLPVSIHIDFSSHAVRRCCVAQCTGGVLAWNAVQKTVTWQPTDGPKQIERFSQDSDEIYTLQLQHFFECIENNEKPAVPLEAGAAVLRMVEAARESSANGQTIVLT